MENKISQTKMFLKKVFDESQYFKDHVDEKNYRLEHSYRVSNIGKEIATQEGLNVEAMVIGCLLHDISYGWEFNSKEDWLNHGRNAAKIARPFLGTLGFDKQEIDDICYGIAIHVDDEADFFGNKNAFTLTIGEADNIDRFDVYRLYENLQKINFDTLSLDKKTDNVLSYLEKIEKLKAIKLSTVTANNMWLDKLNFQAEFFERLLKQLFISHI